MSINALPEIVASGIYNASLHTKGREETFPRRTTMFELELPISGGGVSYINNESAFVTENMIICAKPGEIRHTLLPFKCYFIHMIVKDEALAALLMKLPNYIPLEERFEAERLFREIADAYSTGLYEDSLLLYSRLFALLYLLSAHLTEETAKTGQSHKEMIEGVIGFIKENLTSDLSLEKVAAYASFSPIHFHNCFKRSTGKTLREFVEEARLHRAVELLVGTDMTLSEIAYAAGFSSQAYFSAVFKRRMGKPPRAYARELQKTYEK